MRWKACRITFLAGLVGLPLMLAGTVHAAPADISGARQVTFDACYSSTAVSDPTLKCVVRATGDFDGDGFDDLVVERMHILEFAMRMAQPIKERQIDVLFGPFAQAPAGQPAAAASSTLWLGFEQPFVPVTVADVNQDGVDDIVLAAHYRTNGQPGAPSTPTGTARISVVLGRSAWPVEIALDDGTGADIVFDHPFTLANGSENPRLPLAKVTAAFADVNGDGKLDALLATDFGATAVNATAVGAVGRNPAGGRSAMPDSTVVVMYGDGEWPARVELRADATYSDLGQCAKSLAGVGDVTGDGVADVVLRHCAGQGLPDALRVVPGVAPHIVCPGLAGTLAEAPPIGPGHVEPIGPALPADLGRVAAAMHGGGAAIDGAYDAAVGTDGADGDVPPPDPGRGYLPASQPGESTPVFLEDIDADGTLDIVLGLGQNAHIWLGGADVADKVARQHTDRVFVEVGFGDLGRTGGWHITDLDGDGRNDWLLTDVGTSATTVNNNQVTTRTGPPPAIHIFRGGRPELDVLDLLLDEPEARWENPAMPIWAMGDFDNDDHIDLLLGDTVNLGRSVFAVAYGPFAGQ